MYDVLLDSLKQWNATKTDRQKLQAAYVVLIIALIFIAGVVSLLNADFTGRVVTVVLVLLTAFLTNLVAWSLLSTLVLDKLSRRSAGARSAKPTRK